MSEKGAKPSVLLTIKEDALEHSIRDFLREFGVERMRTHSTPKEAVGHLRDDAEKWDIFVLDGSFPGALERVLEVRTELNSSIQILIILSNPTREDIVGAASMGVNDFITTPFAQKTFEDKLGAMSGRRNKTYVPSPFSVPPG